MLDITSSKNGNVQHTTLQRPILIIKNAKNKCKGDSTQKRAFAFVGKNHHAASAQNLQQTPAGFLLRFPKRHRQLLPLLPWGYSCGRGNPKNRAGGCSTLWRAHRKSAAARPLPPRALPDFRRPPALPPETVTWYCLFPLYEKAAKTDFPA